VLDQLPATSFQVSVDTDIRLAERLAMAASQPFALFRMGHPASVGQTGEQQIPPLRFSRDDAHVSCDAMFGPSCGSDCQMSEIAAACVFLRHVQVYSRCRVDFGSLRSEVPVHGCAI